MFRIYEELSRDRRHGLNGPLVITRSECRDVYQDAPLPWSFDHFLRVVRAADDKHFELMKNAKAS